MCLRFFLPTLLFLSTISMASADAVDYQVIINTTSVSGTPGSLDFQFNPGSFLSQSASVQVLAFTTDGTLVPPAMPTGDVTGTLPSTLAFDNGTAFNDYFEAFTFGNFLRFDVSLFGPALSSPDGTATSGSNFAFSMFSDAAGTVPALTADPDGFAFTVDVNLAGATAVTNHSAETIVSPEPGSVVLLTTVAGLLGLLKLGRARPARL
jgi:hypothetical protein